MELSCYRCGAQVEEHTTFCPGCGAPQIRVASPAAAANQPFTPPVPPGTLDSIHPPALPLQLVPAGQIQWKKFLRIALPLSIMSGVTLAFFGILGLVLFLAGIIIAVRRYRNHHPGRLMASHGVRLGAAAGMLSYLVFLIVGAIQVSLNFSEFRRQWVLNVQQRLESNPDPQIQQFAHWAISDQGLLVLGVVSLVITLIVVMVLSGMIGALATGVSADKWHG